MHRLEVLNLKKNIKKTNIINGVSLEIKSGEVVGLLGPNGAGKTTTFYMICGLILPSSGQIMLDGKDITSNPLHKRAMQGIGYLPQESSIFKDLTVEENLTLAAQIVYKDSKSIDAKVEEMLNLLNIEPIRSRKGLSLSGGERRRCEIARSLMIMPKFLLLDEPFAGVDPIAVADIQSIINDLKKLNIGILITDHNVRETLAICDRAYVIKSGTLLASGSANEVANNQLVRTHYLGEEFRLLD
ncbi:MULTISPECIES: LPS export ABC transporter ATP-binding protein [Campylobacter]|jgi:lipopolysaccharide export system ATP-binding protein|uniref:LPS export ABC transporter ATP-binding protein n=1 Tax=Campylobacter TaxID=194 RepID=UPI000A3531F1|nr:MULTISPECIES: LPS export ABC transporter ATP-binding protein [unclassified Campylobacter]MEE3711643.1 LPS export ABC transporter ATP-binding protein [Campylobacter sp. CLAX-7218-21]MBP3676085.1 LPS export ABC transporter ATP-binding protein [Campylobacter sp.]MBR2148518.1 LPS export ABC transporter ATP-binding protein [Campylobacter sp.]MBR2158885.1 LPS export ABC transporter ATP-binding protein [Campylobacter sp.]MBR2163784.1 LPS export ABC transporter ATP-binding protein [Campylobacter sp